MGLAPIKTSIGTGYCDCVCGCYHLVSLRDEESGKAYCPRCAKEHLELNKGVGLPRPAPSKMPTDAPPTLEPHIPEPADPPGRLR